MMTTMIVTANGKRRTWNSFMWCIRICILPKANESIKLDQLKMIMKYNSKNNINWKTVWFSFSISSAPLAYERTTHNTYDYVVYKISCLIWFYGTPQLIILTNVSYDVFGMPHMHLIGLTIKQTSYRGNCILISDHFEQLKKSSIALNINVNCSVGNFLLFHWFFLPQNID